MDYVQAIVIILGAGISTYVGVRIAIAEMRKDIKSNKENIDRHEKDINWLRDKIIS